MSIPVRVTHIHNDRTRGFVLAGHDGDFKPVVIETSPWFVESFFRFYGDELDLPVWINYDRANARMFFRGDA